MRKLSLLLMSALAAGAAFASPAVPGSAAPAQATVPVLPEVVVTAKAPDRKPTPSAPSPAREVANPVAAKAKAKAVDAHP
jgi:hypothetical protein